MEKLTASRKLEILQAIKENRVTVSYGTDENGKSNVGLAAMDDDFQKFASRLTTSEFAQLIKALEAEVDGESVDA